MKQMLQKKQDINYTSRKELLSELDQYDVFLPAGLIEHTYLWEGRRLYDRWYERHK
jgi:hypothetical protein